MLDFVTGAVLLAGSTDTRQKQDIGGRQKSHRQSDAADRQCSAVATHRRAPEDGAAGGQ
jgi:hypothetical protein